jgi:hypothetical protein
LYNSDADPQYEYSTGILGSERCGPEYGGGGTWDAPANIADCRAGSSAGLDVASGRCTRYLEWSAGHSDITPGNDDYGDPEYSVDNWSRQCLTAAGISPQYIRHTCSWSYWDEEDGPGTWSAPWDQGEWVIASVTKALTNGWYYYLCGPSRNVNGPGSDRYEGGEQRWNREDAYHGNRFAKSRLENYGTSLSPLYQAMRSMGNRSDAVYRCTGGSPVEIATWDTVEAVDDPGPLTTWATPRDEPFACPISGSTLSTTIPPIPGLKYDSPPDADGVRTPLCTFSYGGRTPTFYGGHIVEDGEVWIWTCIFSDPSAVFPNCSPDVNGKMPVYQRVDLNLDGGGVPQLHDYDLGITMLEPDGDPYSPTAYPDTPYNSSMILQTGGRPVGDYDCYSGEISLTAGGVGCPKGTPAGCS